MSFTDLDFAVQFANDIEPSAVYVVPGGTEDPVSHTGQSVTSGSNVISGSSGWTSGITTGQRIQVAYKVNDLTGDSDQTSGANNGWKRAFQRQNAFVGVVTATTVTVVDQNSAALNASYTYTNGSPPSNLGSSPLTVRTWNFSTVDPTLFANCLCRYGAWVGYAKTGVNADGRLFFQQQNFTSFNVKAVADDTTNGLGEVNSAVVPGSSLFFNDRDVKDDIAGFGLGYLSKKRKSNVVGAVSCSVVASGGEAYVGAWFIFPPVYGGSQGTDPRDPYNETTLTSTTSTIVNNGQTVGLHVTGTYAGNLLKLQSAPTIPNGSAGVRLTVINLDATVTIRLYDEASTTAELGSSVLTNLRLGAGHRDLKTGAVIALTFAKDEAGNTFWYETAYNQTAGSTSTANLDVPQIYLSGGAANDPFTSTGFLSLTSAINLGATTSLGNFIRYAPTVFFQDGLAAGTHNAFALSGSWINDASTTPVKSTIGDVWGIVDSRTFIARGLDVIATGGTNNRINTIWHNRTYFGDRNNWDDPATPLLDDIGDYYSLTLKGEANLRNRVGSQFNDTTLTAVTYSGATLNVTNVTGSAPGTGAQAQAGATATGRVTGFPFIASDVGKTWTHAAWTGTVTIQSLDLGSGDGLGNYSRIVTDTAASGTATATGTIHDPSTTLTPTGPQFTVAHMVAPLTNAPGGDGANRGLDISAAMFLGGNVYGGDGSSGNLWPTSVATWTVTTTGVAQFGVPGNAQATPLSAISNTETFVRILKDTGSAASTAGTALGALLFQGTKGTTGASADWTTAAAIEADNDSNAAWSSGVVPGRLLIRTNSTGSTVVRAAFDHFGGIHFGNYATTSNVISSSYVAIDSAGKTWFGPTAYTSGAPSAAPATINNAGAITGASLNTGSGAISGGALTATTGTFAGALTGITALTMTGALTQGSSGQLTSDASGNFATSGTIGGGALTVTSGTFSGAITGVTTFNCTGAITETASSAAAQFIGQRGGAQAAAGNNLASFTGTGADAGAVQRNAAQVVATADGTIVSATNAPGRISILTASASSGLTQRAVFDSAGGFGVGSSATVSSNTFNVTSAGVLAAGATTLSGDLTVSTHNIVTDTSTGTQIGTSTSQKLGFFGHATAAQQTQGATLTNNITSGGSANTLANYTSLTTYSTDAATIRNNLYQLGQTLKTVVDALRTYGLLS